MKSGEMSIDKKTINLKDFEVPHQYLRSIKFQNTFKMLKFEQKDEIFFDLNSLCYQPKEINSQRPKKFNLNYKEGIYKIYQIEASENNKLKFIEQQSLLIFQLNKNYRTQITSENYENSNSFKFLILTTFDNENYFISDYLEEQSLLSFSDYISQFISGQQNQQIINQQEIKNQIHQYQGSSDIITLRGNYISSINDLKTKEYLKSLINLKQLYLKIEFPYIHKDNQFKDLSDIIITYQNIQTIELTLSFNILTNLDMTSLGNTFAAFRKLERLKLIMNNIFNETNQDNSSEGWNTLFLGISQCKLLTLLNIILNDNNLNNLQIQQMMKHVTNMSSLKKLKLNLHENKINNLSEPGMLSNISKCQNLQQLTLILEQNQITDQDSLIFQFEKLNQLQNLKKLTLDLYQNNIGKKGCEKISEGISQLIKLEYLYLDISDNMVEEEGANHLIKGISQCTSLKILKLFISQTGLSNNNIILFGEKLQELQNVQHLTFHFSHNDIFSTQIEILIKQINKLQNLKVLQLSYSIQKSPEENTKYLRSLLLKNLRLVKLKQYIL